MEGLTPPRAPRRMDVRPLDGARTPERPNRSAGRLLLAALIRRTAIFGLGLATVALLAWFLAGLLAADGNFTWLETAATAAFVLCLAPVGVSFWIALAGFACLAIGAPRPGLRTPATPPSLPSRTALVLTLYNDDPAERFASLEGMMRGLAALPPGPDLYEVFVLSDTRSAEKAAIEAEYAARLQRTVAGIPLWYRHRERNTGHKSGNIAEFCRAWGGRYDHMLVLDADSVMGPETIRRMVGLMEANPDAGLVQAPVRARPAETGFGALQGYAMSVYGPVFEHGMSFLNLGDGNYYGHNAIIRMEAFAGDACLPELSGHAPRGGLVLSHDFVEAAFLRRAGWRVWMAPELDDSYEECPPNLIAFATRDRRWCQGNLQHLRILGARGLHPMSRFHLGWGALAYLGAALWLLFLLLGAGVIAERELVVHNYFDANRRLFPIWPVFDLEQATLLLIATLALLLLPRALAVLHHLAVTRAWMSPLRTGAVLGAFAVEVIHSTLTAPVLMVCHVRFVVAFALGRSVSWSPRQGEDGALPIGTCLSVFGVHSAVGLAVAAAVWLAAPQLLGWTAPIWVSLALAPAVAWLSARPLSKSLAGPRPAGKVAPEAA